MGVPQNGWFMSWKIPSINAWFRATPIYGNPCIQSRKWLWADILSSRQQPRGVLAPPWERLATFPSPQNLESSPDLPSRLPSSKLSWWHFVGQNWMAFTRLRTATTTNSIILVEMCAFPNGVDLLSDASESVCLKKSIEITVVVEPIINSPFGNHGRIIVTTNLDMALEKIIHL